MKLPHVRDKHIANVEPVLVVNPCSCVQKINEPGHGQGVEGHTSPGDVQNEDPSEQAGDYAATPDREKRPRNPACPGRVETKN